MKQREEIISNYFDGYNKFDIERMCRDLDHSLRFENFREGKMDALILGVKAFKKQAERVVPFFLSRQITIISFHHTDEKTEADIDYTAIIAIDLPNGAKAGDHYNITGRSIFTFSGNIIKAITDIS